MSQPTYNGNPVPIITIPPSWEDPVDFSMGYGTIIREALDASEERWQTRPRPLYSLRYTSVGLTAQETSFARKFFETLAESSVGCPFWMDAVPLTVAANAGDTTLFVASTANRLFSVFPTYALVWTDFQTLEVVELDIISDTNLTLKAAITKNWDTSAVVVPLAFGYCTRPGSLYDSADLAAITIEFRENFNAIAKQDTTTIEQPDPVPMTLTETSCKEEFVLAWPQMEGAERYLVEIGTNQGGPWSDLITTKLFSDPMDPNRFSVRVNNEWDGSKWFRIRPMHFSGIVGSIGISRTSPVNPHAPTVPIPVFTSLTNVDDVSVLNGLIALPVHGDGTGDVSDGLMQEAQWQPLISSDDLYVRPMKRFEYDDNQSLNLHSILTFASPPNGSIKWTRDGSEPTSGQTNPDQDGDPWNIGAYYPSFQMILKARVFYNGCRSPLFLILVDKRANIKPSLIPHGMANSISQTCDGPPKSGTVHSGQECKIILGNDPVQTMKERCCSGLTAAAFPDWVVQDSSMQVLIFPDSPWDHYQYNATARMTMGGPMVDTGLAGSMVRCQSFPIVHEAVDMNGSMSQGNLFTVSGFAGPIPDFSITLGVLSTLLEFPGCFAGAFTIVRVYIHFSRHEFN